MRMDYYKKYQEIIATTTGRRTTYRGRNFARLVEPGHALTRQKRARKRA